MSDISISASKERRRIRFPVGVVGGGGGRQATIVKRSSYLEKKEKFASNWILSSCQPHMVTVGPEKKRAACQDSEHVFVCVCVRVCVCVCVYAVSYTHLTLPTTAEV